MGGRIIRVLNQVQNCIFSSWPAWLSNYTGMWARSKVTSYITIYYSGSHVVNELAERYNVWRNILAKIILSNNQKFHNWGYLFI